MKITLTRNVPASEEPPEVEVEVPALPRVGDEIAYADADKNILIEGPVEKVTFWFNGTVCDLIYVDVKMPVDEFR